MISLVKDIKHEKCIRKTFAKTEDSIEMPNLIKVQKDSYEWFVKEGLGEVLKDIKILHSKLIPAIRKCNVLRSERQRKYAMKN